MRSGTPSIVLFVALAHAAACGDVPRPQTDELISSSAELYSNNFLPTFHVSLSPESWDSLEQAPKVYVPGTFRYGPYTFHDVGVRLKGNATLRTLDEKPSFKIKFNKYEPGVRFFDLESITLNNMEQDPTMVREWLSYHMFRAAGAPASRTGYAEVMLNGELLGLYINLETVDESFLERNFADPSGGLYEGDYGDDLHPSHVWRFEQDEGSDPNREDLLALTQWVHQDGDVIFYDDDTLLDFPQFLTYSALEATIGHWDGYWIAHNYRIYHEPTLDKWTFIPWGMDQTYRKHTEPFDQLAYLSKRCRESARCLPAYVNRTLEIIELMEAQNLEAELLQIANTIDEAARRDPRKSHTNSSMDAKRESLLDFVAERPTELRAWLDCVDGDVEIDADNDGYGKCYRDCDDRNDAIRPDADELCDDLDNNCSGNVDDNLECGCPSAEIAGVPFLFCDIDLNFEKSATWCANLGGTLARIESAEQNDAVWQQAQSVREDTWYIGMTDIGRDEGDFYWIDGGEISYEAWAPNEPNFDGAEHCVHMRRSAPLWNDIACGNKKPFVCRVDDNPGVPNPE